MIANIHAKILGMLVYYGALKTANEDNSERICRDLKRLRREERISQRIAEHHCNGGTFHRVNFNFVDYDEPENPIEKMEQQNEANIKAILAEIDPYWSVEFQGDPRGYTVKVFDQYCGNKRELSHLLFMEA